MTVKERPPETPPVIEPKYRSWHRLDEVEPFVTPSGVGAAFIGGMTGGTIAGPIGAVAGVIAGAAFGNWFDHYRASLHRTGIGGSSSPKDTSEPRKGLTLPEE